MRNSNVGSGRYHTVHNCVIAYKVLLFIRIILVVAWWLAAAQAGWAEPPGIEAALRQGKAADVLPELRRLADAGDADAAFDLGLLNDIGQGVPQNFEEARRWYERAAAAGNPTAAFNVGVLYDAGRGVPEDRAEAARWYLRAAEKGFGRAEYNLGLMYLRGDGVPRDEPQARRYFQAAAQHGVGAAADQLASLARAEDVNGDVAFAEVEAQILERGLSGLDAAAVKKLLKAAKKGNALARYDLAYCYEHGIGLPADRVEAFVWYSRSANAPGNAPSSSATARTAATSGAGAVWAQMTSTEQQAAEALLGHIGHQ
jgi:TPR repeat protein